MLRGRKASKRNMVPWVNGNHLPILLEGSDRHSIVNYLRDHRLQWGKPDNLSLLHSRLADDTKTTIPATNPDQIPNNAQIPKEVPAYFTADTPSELISIIMNDWPYSGATSPSVLLACS